MDSDKIDTKNKISVIVAIYNVGQYLNKCIDSIIQQTYENIEIILIDDGSTDQSIEICDKYKEEDGRITVIHQDNGGLVNARKTGLKIATGKYIVFVDGDDSIKMDMCEKMLKYIQKWNVDFVHMNHYENSSREVDGIKKEVVYKKETPSSADRVKMINDRVFNIKESTFEHDNVIMPNIWKNIFEANFIKKCYNMVPDEQSYGEDLICLCHVIMQCHSMAFTTGAYYNYSIRNDTLSHTYNFENMVSISQLYINLKQIFIKYNCWNELSEGVKIYCEKNIFHTLKYFNEGELHINRYYFNDIDKIKSKRIILYGAGEVGKDYYDQICRYESIVILDWVDRNCNKINLEYYQIKDVERLLTEDYDVIIVAVLDSRTSEQITNSLIEMGINKKKIFWKKPGKYSVI